jgi:hypothetical protein
LGIINGASSQRAPSSRARRSIQNGYSLAHVLPKTCSSSSVKQRQERLVPRQIEHRAFAAHYEDGGVFAGLHIRQGAGGGQLAPRLPILQKGRVVIVLGVVFVGHHRAAAGAGDLHGHAVGAQHQPGL